MDESEWVSIAVHGEIPLGGRKCCSVNGRPVVVIRLADQLCAFAFSPNFGRHNIDFSAPPKLLSAAMPAGISNPLQLSCAGRILLPWRRTAWYARRHRRARR